MRRQGDQETNRASHTPGPWRFRVADSGDPAGIQVYSVQGASVATIKSARVHGVTDENKIANARLIAAAPEMADAGNTLAAYVYSILNPGEIPEHVKAAMRVFEAVS